MGLIMAGLGGAAEVGMNQMQDQRKADLQTERDLAQEESGKRLAQYNSDLALKRSEALEKIRAQSVIDKENYDLSPERLGKVAEADKTRFTLGADVRQMQAKEKTAAVLTEEQARLDFLTTNHPTLVRQAQDMARAKHIEGAGSVATARLANMNIDEKIEVKKLVDSFASEKDPAKKAEKRQELIDRQIIKPEYETEKVTDVIRDPNTGEETQRREKTVRSKGGLIGSGGAVSQTEEGAHAQARQVLAAGRASLEEVNKRLGAAGYKPIDAPQSNSQKSLSELKRIATKPKGVSSAEANAAQAEIDYLTNNPDRMKAF